jgi:hypothetical protein
MKWFKIQIQWWDSMNMVMNPWILEQHSIALPPEELLNSSGRSCFIDLDNLILQQDLLTYKLTICCTAYSYRN